MFIAVVSLGICAYCTVLIILGKRYYEKKEAFDRLKKMSQAPSKKVYSDEELYQPLIQRVFVPMGKNVVKRVSSALPNSTNEKLSQQLMLAGISTSTQEYQAMQLIIVSIFTLIGCIAGFIVNRQISSAMLLGLFGSIVGTLIIRYNLIFKVNKRTEEIKQQIPEVLDLLSVSVEAGLGFDAALGHVAERFEGALIDEFMQVQYEIQLGRPRRDALKNLADRCQLEELKSFTSAVIQAEQLGISLKNVLKAQAAYIRQQRRQAVEEKAMKAPVKIMIPLTLFIFPVLFIILLGPAVINLIDMLGEI